MPLGKMTVRVDRAAIEALGAPGGLADIAVAKAAGRTRDRAKQNLTAAGRVDMGTLRQSIVSERAGGSGGRQVTYEIGSPLMYGAWSAALLHERGTGIYGPAGRMIVPRRARVLRWKPGKNSGIPKGRASADGFVYAPSVKGMRGTHFLENALNQLTVADFTR